MHQSVNQMIYVLIYWFIVKDGYKVDVSNSGILKTKIKSITQNK